MGLFIICLFHIVSVFAEINCSLFFENGRFEWMWMSTGSSGTMDSGTADFYSNGTIATWNKYGELINYGTYEITQNGSWCYAYEVFSYPSSSITCKTFTVDEVSNSLVGCLLSNECYPTCSTPEQWETWSAARLVSRID